MPVVSIWCRCTPTSKLGGKLLSLKQGGDRAEYGAQVLKQLAQRMTNEFGDGFSVTKLKLMRQFYVLYATRIGQTASGFSVPSRHAQ